MFYHCLHAGGAQRLKHTPVSWLLLRPD